MKGKVVSAMLNRMRAQECAQDQELRKVSELVSLALRAGRQAQKKSA